MHTSINKMVSSVLAVAVSFSMIVSAVPVVDTAPIAPTAAFALARSPAAADLPLPTNYCSTCVYHHNLHRMNHSAPLVTYDQSVATYASKEIAGCPAQLSEEAGSNWFGSWGTGTNSQNNAEVTVQAISAWYEQESVAYSEATEDYTVAPNLNVNFDSYGHFTQMVWHAETTIGCYSVFCDKTTPFTSSKGADWGWQVACASSPAGNVGPASPNYVDNVTRPLGQAPSNYGILSNNPC